MSDLRELYQQLIIDHGRKPRNFGALSDANYIKDGYNPLCGDKITLYLKAQANTIEEVQFEGCGCAISMASASLMTQVLKGKTFDEVTALFHLFHDLVTTGAVAEDADRLGKLMALAGVAEYPSRVKCATLAWHTAIAAISKSDAVVTTE